MSNETLKRNRYSEPPFSEGDFSARHFDEDFQDYHLPLARLQVASLQDWGVARGLQVGGTPGETTVTVEPGVALDGQGRLISLSTDGKGDIGSNPLNEEHEEVAVPVRLDLGSSAPAETEASYYVTIQFSEILRFDEGPLGRFEHAPWVRLQPAAGEEAYVDDGTSIVLAEAVVDAGGRLVELRAGARRLTGRSVSALTVRRPVREGDRVSQAGAGRIGPEADGGLRIAVPEADDSVVLVQEDGGNFERLEVRADTVRLGNDLKVAGNLEVQGDVIARDTEHVAGNVSFGDQDDDEIKVAGVLRTGHSSGRLRVDDALHTTGSLTAAGNLGIGVDNPGRPLSVRGRNGGSELVSLSDSTGNTKWHLNMLGAGLNFVETGVRDYRLFLKQGGNVGIGTGTPRSTLDVAGTMTAEKLVGEGAAVRNMIVMWSGAIGDIPRGWGLCDGRNGTPDLRRRFILGIASDSEGRTGGSRSHSHTTSRGDNRTRDAIVDVAAAGKRRDNYSDEIHTHSVSTSDHLPPFYKLAFIMKL